MIVEAMERWIENLPEDDAPVRDHVEWSFRYFPEIVLVFIFGPLCVVVHSVWSRIQQLRATGETE